MARQRIKNTFDSVNKVVLSVSGGKDSIVLNNLIFEMCQSGEINKNKIIVDFIDEEAIYPCVEKIVKNMRIQWLSVGVPFRWWCIQVKHFNCFNQLTQDESFICWDKTKHKNWIRKKPKWALVTDPLLNERKDSYQEFLDKKNKNIVTILGVRASESVQRLNSLASRQKQDKVFPIYDWTDTDIWNYIREKNLEYPIAYEHMYRVGVGLNRMRISQFFSVDTAASLVQMCEFYPELFEKICNREPNAYLAMLYFDTELFRRKKKSKDDTNDYKEKFFEVLKEEWRFETKLEKETKRQLINLVFKFGIYFDNQIWKMMYECIIGGDPKSRVRRLLYITITKKMRKESYL